MKITYIGGGSKMWAPIFMNDLALSSYLSGEVILYDINSTQANINELIGNKITSIAPSKWNYKVCLNLEESLQNADVVIISILPGTFDEMEVDVELPKKYNIFQSVGDTVGPGGILRSMRTVPLFEEFALKIKEICPNAWVVNFTNPMSICVKTLFDVFPDIKAFGCCHEVFHTQDFLCKILKEEKNIDILRKDIYTDVVGINHFTWFTKATYKNIDLLDLARKFTKKYIKIGYYEHGSNDLYKTNPFAYANLVKMDLLDKYGMLPAAGDRHLVEFMNNDWYIKNEEHVESFKYALTTIDYRRKLQEERINESLSLSNGTKPIEIKKSDEEAVEILEALLGYNTKVTNVNYPNVGQVPYFPMGAIVETNALFTNNQLKPITVNELPLGPKNLILRNLYNIELLYEGIKKRDLKIIFNSFINQPLCSKLSFEEAKKLFKEMILKTKNYLDMYYNLEQDF